MVCGLHAVSLDDKIVRRSVRVSDVFPGDFHRNTGFSIGLSFFFVCNEECRKG